MAKLNQQQATEDTSIRIVNKDEVVTLDYADLENFHDGDSWFGCTVGYRAMQAVATVLSKNNLWSRGNLYVVSGHPGPGVKDAIEIITHCISKNRFQLLDENNTEGCNRDMKFEWWVSNGRITAHVKLHDGIVPENFYALLDRITTSKERKNDRDEFEQYKNELSQLLWQQPIKSSFNVEVLPTPLSIGDLPNA